VLGGVDAIFHFPAASMKKIYQIEPSTFSFFVVFLNEFSPTLKGN
jgi:hypothetical protein